MRVRCALFDFCQAAAGLILLLGTLAWCADENRCVLHFLVNDQGGQALPCRIHLLDAAGKPPKVPPDLPFWNDHFVSPGQARLSLLPGTYRYEIERGPEHHRVAATVELRRGRDQKVSVVLPRDRKSVV